MILVFLNLNVQVGCDFMTSYTNLACAVVRLFVYSEGTMLDIVQVSVFVGPMCKTC